MERKKLAAIAAICGVVAAIAVLLPWYSASMDGGPLGSRSESVNGTEGEFSGTFVLILALLGAAAAGLVAAQKTDVLPLDERQHLFAALALFALAVIVNLTDVFRDLPSGSQDMGVGKMSMGKSFGLYLTLLAAAAAAVAAFLAARKPGTSAES